MPPKVTTNGARSPISSPVNGVTNGTHRDNRQTASNNTASNNNTLTLETLPFDVLYQIFLLCDVGTLRRLAEAYPRIRPSIAFYYQLRSTQ